MAIIQFRVDDNLKEQATKVYDNLGIDLSTALRMFLRRSIMVNGIPFSMTLDENSTDNYTPIEAPVKMQTFEIDDTGEITLEEIRRAHEERIRK